MIEGAKCAMCDSDKKLSFEPTRHALLFGGFRARSEYRCKKCEKEVLNWARKLLKKKGF